MPTYSYFLMFIAMMAGGPAITAASAFGASLGYFDIWIVFGLSILGNLLPDLFYYALGYFGFNTALSKFAGRDSRFTKRMAEFKKVYEENVGRTVTAVKLLPFAATPGLIAAGMAKVRIKEYAFWCLIVTLPTSGLFLIIGYFFGSAYKSFIDYFDYAGYAVLIAIVIFFIIASVHKKLSFKLSRKIHH